MSTDRCLFGLFEFDPRTGELRRDGEIVLGEELRAHLWGQDTFVDFERGLNFCILPVRSALGDSSENPRFIQTVPRKGYRFIAPVTSVPAGDLRPSLAPPSPLATSVPPGDLRPPPLAQEFSASYSEAMPKRPTAAEAGPQRRRPSPARLAGIALAALVIMAPVAWLVLGRGQAPAAVASSADPRLRLAVLPFVNLTGDSGADHLVDGLTDELIAQLGRVSPNRLGVIARTSVMRYRNTDTSIAEVGRDLDVGYVVEGSVRREGTRLRVTTDLVKVSDQAQIWSDAFERSAGDSMDLQTDVAVRVARALALELVPGVTGPPLPKPTPSADAWDAYLRGRFFLNRGRSADIRQSIEHFETALRFDPQFAAGWAELAEAQHVLVMVGGAVVRARPCAQSQQRRRTPRLRVVSRRPRPLRRSHCAHHRRARSRCAFGARQHRHRLALLASAAAHRGHTRVSTPSRFNPSRWKRRRAWSAPTFSVVSLTKRSVPRAPRSQGCGHRHRDERVHRRTRSDPRNLALASAANGRSVANPLGEPILDRAAARHAR